jgi:NTP pyrophosphatase (non-canonical NTP hydrolase)
MTEEEYLTASAITASRDYFSSQVSPSELDKMFRAATVAVTWADDCKKSLYYGREYRRRGGAADGQTSLEHKAELSDILHAALGMFTEAGEILEQLQEVLSGTRQLDTVNLHEEMGDLYWYLAMMHRSLGTTPSEAWETNIAKLRRRYEGKFTANEALNRDLDAERKILEGDRA